MRALCAASLSLAVGFAGSVGCGSDPKAPPAGPDTCYCTVSDGGSPGLDAGSAGADGGQAADAATAPAPDAAVADEDAAASGPDAEADGGDAQAPVGADADLPSGVDADLPVGPDAALPAGPDAFVALDYDAGPKPCSYNSDCPPNERCNDPSFVCTIGPRGSGKTGVDTCTTGNDCEGAICAEGWPEGTYYCSGECGGDAGSCGGQLTVCMYVPFIGKMCARNLDGGR